MCRFVFNIESFILIVDTVVAQILECDTGIIDPFFLGTLSYHKVEFKLENKEMMNELRNRCRRCYKVGSAEFFIFFAK